MSRALPQLSPFVSPQVHSHRDRPDDIGEPAARDVEYSNVTRTSSRAANHNSYQLTSTATTPGSESRAATDRSVPGEAGAKSPRWTTPSATQTVILSGSARRRRRMSNVPTPPCPRSERKPSIGQPAVHGFLNRSRWRGVAWKPWLNAIFQFERRLNRRERNHCRLVE